MIYISLILIIIIIIYNILHNDIHELFYLGLYNMDRIIINSSNNNINHVVFIDLEGGWKILGKDNDYDIFIKNGTWIFDNKEYTFLYTNNTIPSIKKGKYIYYLDSLDNNIAKWYCPEFNKYMEWERLTT